MLPDGAKETVITLADDKYPDEVDLHIVAYPDENIIKEYTVIKNNGKKPVTLDNYASSMLHFNRNAYYLTQYNGDWISEVVPPKLSSASERRKSTLSSAPAPICLCSLSSSSPSIIRQMRIQAKSSPAPSDGRETSDSLSRSTTSASSV